MKHKNIFRTVVSAMIAILCAVSTVLMGKDVLGDVMILSKSTNLLLLAAVIVIALFFEYYGPDRKQTAFACAAFSAVFAFAALLKRGILKAGTALLINRYLRLYNIYYKTQIQLSGEGTEEEMIWALGFFLLLFLSICYLLAVLSDRYGILLAPPALILSLELLVGYCPQGAGLFLFACCAVLVCSRTWRVKGQEKSFVFLVLTFAGALCVSLAFLQGVAEKIGNKQEDMLAFQRNVETWATKTAEQIVLGDKGLVDNHAPKYKDVEVLHLWMDDPMENGIVYLKGYYGASYKNGRWYDDVSKFRNECKQQGFEDVAEQLIRQEYDFMQKMPPVECRLTDKGTRSQLLHLPNFTDPDSLKGYQLVGNYEYKKAGKKKKTRDFQFSYNNTWFEKLYPENVPQVSSTPTPELRWYEQYVQENYLKDSDQIENIRYYALKIKLETEWELGDRRNQMRRNALALAYAKKTAEYLGKNYKYSLEPEALPVGTEPIGFFLNSSKEGYCVHFASAGTMLLREIGVPARYVGGYIAKDGKKTEEDGGYAVSVLDSNAHAWVEIYLFGIGWYPIDMTPGSVTNENTVLGSEKPSTSESQERPENTQIPSATEENPSGNEPQQTESGTGESETVSEDESGSDSEGVTESGGGSEGESGTGSENGTEGGEPGGSNGSGGNGGSGGSGGSNGNGGSGGSNGSGGNGNGNGGSDGNGSGAGGTNAQRAFRMTVRVFLLFAAWLLTAFLLLRIYRIHMGKCIGRIGRIYRELKHESYNRAVFHMNRQLYRQLRKKGRLTAKNPSDPQYRDCLIRAYPQTESWEWENFVETAKKCVFSLESLTEEEARYCCKVFERNVEPVVLAKWRVFYLLIYVFTAFGVIFLIF